MKLPTAKSKPRQTLGDLTILLYGPPKIGKSTFCSHVDNGLFLATEPGLNSLEVFQAPCATWDDIVNAITQLENEKHQFRTTILDTVDNAYIFCVNDVLTKHRIEYPGDLPYGKGWGMISSQFENMLTRLARLPHGLILVSHSQDREFQTRTGPITKTIPTLPDRARQAINKLVDVILYCEVEEVKGEDGQREYNRIMHSKPHPNFEAGDRTGLLPAKLPLDINAFRKAFKGVEK